MIIKFNLKYLFFLGNYAVARKKLKEAEELSDINSGTDLEENLKRSRKLRAAKVIDESMSNDDELSDDMILSSEIPKFPNKHSMSAKISKEALKLTKNSQKADNGKIIIKITIID